MSRWSWQILDWQRQWSIPLHQCCNPRFVEQLHGGHQKLLGKIILHKRLMFIALESCAHKFYLEILDPFGNPRVRVLERIVPHNMKGHLCLPTIMTLHNYSPWSRNVGHLIHMNAQNSQLFVGISKKLDLIFWCAMNCEIKLT